jgi:uncharacterized protein YjiS (DUF1127 family)
MNFVTTSTSFAMTVRTVRGELVALLGHFGRQMDNLATVAIVRWKRQAATAALHRLSDRDLKDIGLHRSGIEAALEERAGHHD